MDAHYEAKLVEEVEGMKDELVERVDSYLEYVADEWLQENALQVERGIRTEMTESFLEGMRGLFEEHYVSIPEDKYDVVESMVDKLDEMESKLNEQIQKNITITKSLSEATADGDEIWVATHKYDEINPSDNIYYYDHDFGDALNEFIRYANGDIEFPDIVYVDDAHAEFIEDALQNMYYELCERFEEEVIDELTNEGYEQQD